jgi:formate dehydrogenase subunit beta
MTDTFQLEVTQGDVTGAIQKLLQDALGLEGIDAVLVPRRSSLTGTVMPALVRSSDHLKQADPLAPAFFLNAAKIASRLTRKSSDSHILMVLRPCEIRAFVELVKLNQARLEDVTILGCDCLGAYRNLDYLRFFKSESDGHRFQEHILNGGSGEMEGLSLAPACRICEHPFPDGADVAIGLFGVDTTHHLMVSAQTEKGLALVNALHLAPMPAPATRQAAIDKRTARNLQARDDVFIATHAATDSLAKLAVYLGACVNCYNCRVACPVCYCRECVFVTDVFDHDPAQYMLWADRRGSLKMPTDTLFYHLTRMAHMSTACVGCGQCSNACPNNIPLVELFRAIAHRTQQAFGYEAGRSIDERPPLSEFREREFEEIVGLKT